MSDTLRRMSDTLDRERLDNNIIDRLFAVEERVERLEEALMRQGSVELIIVTSDGTRWRLTVEDPENGAGPGLVLEEL